LSNVLEVRRKESVMSEVSKPNPRELMPNVAAKIDEYRVLWGREHVNECIKRGMAHEPGWFYAFENGYVVGTPFTADSATMELLRLGVALGGRYGVVMKPGAAR
jgi:hypothetical protein